VLERTIEEGLAFVLGDGAESKCLYAGDVGEGDKARRILRSRFESSSNSPGPLSPYTVASAGCFRDLVGGAHRVFGGSEEVMVDSDSDWCPSMALRAGSRVVGCPGLNVGEEGKRWSSFLRSSGIFHNISTNLQGGERVV
jgi:hypothetical protein